MVEAAGQEWPDGWVKGEGFVRPRSTDDPMKPPPTVAEIGEEDVRQIVDLSPGQRIPAPYVSDCVRRSREPPRRHLTTAERPPSERRLCSIQAIQAMPTSSR
jgi:hypothetical protein